MVGLLWQPTQRVWFSARTKSLTSCRRRSWAVKPFLDNVTTGGFAITLDLTGQLHEQVRRLPPGTRITKITVSEG
jgi:hypothetical protein